MKAVIKNPSSTVSESSSLIIIEPPHGWVSLGLADFWHYRDLLLILAWRDIKVRYKQTILGVGWAILQPLFTMLIFSVIFGQLAKLPSEGVPYPVFSYTALLPWQLFAVALTTSSNSLITSGSLISKVYFPRLIIPLASVLAGIVDFAIAFIVLLGMLAYYRITPTLNMLTLPLFILLALATALAVGLWLSALNVKYRDFRYVLPFLAQAWMYLTPIAYSSSLIPEEWKLLYSLNPMTGVVEGFRWALLGTGQGAGSMVLVSTAVVLIILISGLFYFKRMEDDFADLI